MQRMRHVSPGAKRRSSVLRVPPERVRFLWQRVREFMEDGKLRTHASRMTLKSAALPDVQLGAILRVPGTDIIVAARRAFQQLEISHCFSVSCLDAHSFHGMLASLFWLIVVDNFRHSAGPEYLVALFANFSFFFSSFFLWRNAEMNGAVRNHRRLSKQERDLWPGALCALLCESMVIALDLSFHANFNDISNPEFIQKMRNDIHLWVLGLPMAPVADLSVPWQALEGGDGSDTTGNGPDGFTTPTDSTLASPASGSKPNTPAAAAKSLRWGKRYTADLIATVNKSAAALHAEGDRMQQQLQQQQQIGGGALTLDKSYIETVEKELNEEYEAAKNGPRKEPYLSRHQARQRNISGNANLAFERAIARIQFDAMVEAEKAKHKRKAMVRCADDLDTFEAMSEMGSPTMTTRAPLDDRNLDQRFFQIQREDYTDRPLRVECFDPDSTSPALRAIRSCAVMAARDVAAVQSRRSAQQREGPVRGEHLLNLQRSPLLVADDRDENGLSGMNHPIGESSVGWFQQNNKHFVDFCASESTARLRCAPHPVQQCAKCSAPGVQIIPNTAPPTTFQPANRRRSALEGVGTPSSMDPSPSKTQPAATKAPLVCEDTLEKLLAENDSIRVFDVSIAAREASRNVVDHNRRGFVRECRPCTDCGALSGVTRHYCAHCEATLCEGCQHNLSASASNTHVGSAAEKKKQRPTSAATSASPPGLNRLHAANEASDAAMRLEPSAVFGGALAGKVFAPHVRVEAKVSRMQDLVNAARALKAQEEMKKNERNGNINDKNDHDEGTGGGTRKDEKKKVEEPSLSWGHKKQAVHAGNTIRTSQTPPTSRPPSATCVQVPRSTALRPSTASIQRMGAPQSSHNASKGQPNHQPRFGDYLSNKHVPQHTPQQQRPPSANSRPPHSRPSSALSRWSLSTHTPIVAGRPASAVQRLQRVQDRTALVPTTTGDFLGDRRPLAGDDGDDFVEDDDGDDKNTSTSLRLDDTMSTTAGGSTSSHLRHLNASAGGSSVVQVPIGRSSTPRLAATTSSLLHRTTYNSLNDSATTLSSTQHIGGGDALSMSSSLRLRTRIGAGDRHRLAHGPLNRPMKWTTLRDEASAVFDRKLRERTEKKDEILRAVNAINRLEVEACRGTRSSEKRFKVQDSTNIIEAMQAVKELTTAAAKAASTATRNALRRITEIVEQRQQQHRDPPDEIEYIHAQLRDIHAAFPDLPGSVRPFVHTHVCRQRQRLEALIEEQRHARRDRTAYAKLLADLYHPQNAASPQREHQTAAATAATITTPQASGTTVVLVDPATGAAVEPSTRDRETGDVLSPVDKDPRASPIAHPTAAAPALPPPLDIAALLDETPLPPYRPTRLVLQAADAIMVPNASRRQHANLQRWMQLRENINSVKVIEKAELERMEAEKKRAATRTKKTPQQRNEETRHKIATLMEEVSGTHSNIDHQYKSGHRSAAGGTAENNMRASMIDRIQALAGVQRVSVGRGIDAVGGVMIWTDSNTPVGATAQDYLNRRRTAFLHADRR